MKNRAKYISEGGKINPAKKPVREPEKSTQKKKKTKIKPRSRRPVKIVISRSILIIPKKKTCSSKCRSAFSRRNKQIQ
jgi:hypothetical protein